MNLNKERIYYCYNPRKSKFIVTNNNILKLKNIFGRTLNNKEYLIQILLKLRSIGIKNDKILGL